MTMLINGTGVSRGIVMGRVRLLHEIQPRARRKKIKASERRAELSRFRKAVSRSEAELTRAKQQLPPTGSGTVANILDSNIAMLHDPALVEPIENYISVHKYSCEWALAVQRDQLFKMFESIEDPYLRQRSMDVEETIARLLKHLSTRPSKSKKATQAVQQFILVSKNLAPSDLIQQQHAGLIGAVTQGGSTLSHTTIIAKSLRIPLIVSATHAMELLDESDELIIDGKQGTIIANADAATTKSFKSLQFSAKKERKQLDQLKSQATRTKDKQPAQVLANLEDVGEVTKATRSGAEGVGLFRTESLFLNRLELPDEAEHLRVYRGLIKKLKGAPLVVRTMDVWSSRRMPGLEQHIPVSKQPALGLRAIRLCLRHPELFLPQLRALLRASHYGPLSMLLPMVSNVQEVRDILQLVDITKANLERQRFAYNPDMSIGVMVEVPSAAISARLIAPLVDFMAIGSNDLTQYTLAMDREDANVQPLLDPLNPAILFLINETVKACVQHDLPVSLCGEMAGDPVYTRLLLGLGLRHFSMHPANILEVKRAILTADVGKVEKLARSMMRANSPHRTHLLLERINSL
ncbi:MAG: phosphoenolpyruvate--protein phosphotransferase [Gammaproteobacteria bacterium]